MTDERNPSSPEAERAILGAVLLENKIMDELQDLFDGNDLYVDQHKRIYRAMCGLYAERRPIDLVTLRDALEKNEEFAHVGGAAYIASLIDAVPRIDTARYYIDIVRDKAHLRRLARAGEDIRNTAMADTDSGQSVQDWAEQLIRSRRGHEEDDQGSGDVGTLTGYTLDEIEQTQTSGPQGVRTGLLDLDRALVTLEPETLTFIGGRPGSGKTALALTFAVNMAKVGYSVCFFSLEMSRKQFMQRCLSLLASVDLYTVRDGTLTVTDWEKLHGASAILAKLPIYLNTQGGISASQLCAKVRRRVQHKRVDVVLVDYLGLLSLSGRPSEMRFETGSAIRTLRALAKELQIPVIVLAQLSRYCVTGAVRPPIISDFRECGQIEEDADNILLLHRPHLYDSSQPPGQVFIYIGKQRQGSAPNKIEAQFIGKFTRFENVYRPYWGSSAE